MLATTNVFNNKQFPSKYQENTEGDLLTKLRIADRPSAQDILDIAEGRIMAVLISNYCERIIAELAASRIIKDSAKKLRKYDEANIKYRNEPFFDSNNNPQKREKYFQTAFEKAGDFREIFHPYSSPVDKLRLELDEVWDYGANVLRLGGRLMSPAVIRVFRNGGDALPHQDDLGEDAPFELDAQKFNCQLTALTYIKMPKIGGEVKLWDRRFSQAEYNQRRFENSYGLDIKLLPEPDLIIKPSQGDLLIFNASKVHAVNPTLEGERITISSFIGFGGRFMSLGTFQ
jgi:2OG-Fe(II) oxygenase superfamily